MIESLLVQLLELPPADRKLLGRFAELVKVDDSGCCIWQGELVGNGYGRFFISTTEGRQVAHVWLYERLVGPVPREHQLHHTCEVRACVNPHHLVPVTALEHNRITHPPATHCPQGHAYDEANTRRYRGRRYCRACNNNGGSGRQAALAKAVAA